MTTALGLALPLDVADSLLGSSRGLTPSVPSTSTPRSSFRTPHLTTPMA